MLLSGSCITCDLIYPNCITCANSACTVCGKNTYINNGACVSCSLQFYADFTTQTCLPCVSPCLTCYSSTIC